ncbi:hypothetical protein CDAR_200011 [Caerostris darwini]|uniref:Uncharacterized protein n=1 Tax=Caerostris darwini TaxID=1538125 RepID=A0AAV4QXT6_9ARAC|nr:hypothetical protein CDAR_200011 [Caerostris darwini]
MMTRAVATPLLEALCVRGISRLPAFGDYINGLELQVEGWAGVKTSTPEKSSFYEIQEKKYPAVTWKTT